MMRVTCKVITMREGTASSSYRIILWFKDGPYDASSFRSYYVIVESQSIGVLVTVPYGLEKYGSHNESLDAIWSVKDQDLLIALKSTLEFFGLEKHKEILRKEDLP